jgi:hypothetical protein
MSDGHYCFVRDLGPVKGGKGMKHHEVIIDFNRRAVATLLRRAFAKSPKPERSDLIPYPLSARKAPR